MTVMTAIEMTTQGPVHVEVRITRLEDRSVRVELDGGQVSLCADMNRESAIAAALAILTYAEAGNLEIDTDANVVVRKEATP